ncbi:MAG: FeoC-like transcriptional regulator [Sphaerochaetaceae bacterium]
MLKEVLNSIYKNGFLARKMVASELKIPEELVDESINQLIRMNYIALEDTGATCTTTCKGCAFANNCGKEIVKMYKITDRGYSLLS